MKILFFQILFNDINHFDINDINDINNKRFVF